MSERDLEKSTMWKPRLIRAVEPGQSNLNIEPTSVKPHNGSVMLKACVSVCVWFLSDEEPTSPVVRI